MKTCNVAIILILAFASAGCKSWNGPGSWMLVTDLQSNAVPCTLYEHGQCKHLYGAVADVDAMFLFHAVDGTQMSPHLFDHPVHSWEFWKGYAMLWKSRQRNLDTIFDLADFMSPVQEWGKVTPDDANVRWIIGNDPLIIALGTDVVPVRIYGGGGLGNGRIVMGMTMAMVQDDSDLDHTATELLVLDKWPAPWKYTGSEFQKQMVSDIGRITRRIPLPQPTTLREIMNKKLWEIATPISDRK